VGEIRDNVKRNLGYYLSLKGMSQKELAEKLGVSQSAVTNWIKGKNAPDIEMVAQICDALEISVSDLFGADGSKPDAKLEQATSIFQELRPDFQDYVMKQIEQLLEMQNNQKDNDSDR